MTTGSGFAVDLNDAVEAKLQGAQARKLEQHPAMDPQWDTRQEAMRQIAVEAGFKWPATILPPGTALYDSGVEKLTSDRQRWFQARKLTDRIPLAKDGLPAIRNAIAAEDRRDVALPVSAMRLDPADGRFLLPAAAGAPVQLERAGYSPHAFRQLLGQVPGCGPGEAPRGFPSALLYLSGEERAEILNARLPKASASATFRTKLAHDGSRIVRGVLSEKYADVDDLHVAGGIEIGLNGDLGNVRLDYRPGDDRSQFELVWPSEVPVETFCVGDIHYASIAITNSETGRGAIRVVPRLVRAACANMTPAYGEGVEVTLRHMGDAERVRTAMRSAIRQAIGQIEPLVMAIQSSARERFSEITDKSPSELLAQIAKKFGATEERAAAWTDTYERSYASRSPTTWGLTSAITETAQDRESWWTQQEEEEIAAKVVHTGLRKALGF